MAQSKFGALWVSHSRLSEYQKCPRAYYLKYVYKDPVTKKGISVINPSLALGSAVHNVLEPLAGVPKEERFKQDLSRSFAEVWEDYKGKNGGFSSEKEEQLYKNRGVKMLQRVKEHSDRLSYDTAFLEQKLPNIWMSKKENIVLCGKIDWISREKEGLRIIDFKTGKSDEKHLSFQLPIYAYLTKLILKEDVHKISYWYLDSDSNFVDMKIPDLKESYYHIMDIARKIKHSKENNEWKCPKNGCFSCTEYELVLEGKAEKVSEGEYNKNLYILEQPSHL